MLEAEIVRRQLAALNAIDGVYAIRTHGGTFQAKGTPDIFGCALGLFFTIESKRSRTERPSEAQVYMLNKFARAGGRTFVSYDPKVREVLAWISSIEIWKAIPGYEGFYEASSLGEIRSLSRTDARGHLLRTKVLKQRTSEKGYKYVNLFKGDSGKGKRVNRLVALAFHGQPEPGHVARHLDGDSSNNSAINLAWGTQADNERDKKRHG